MCGGERGVKEERFRRVLPAVVAEKLHCMVAQRVGVVKFVRLILKIIGGSDDGIIAHERTGIEITARAMNRPVVAIESTLERPIVPLEHAPVAPVAEGFVSAEKDSSLTN